MAHLPGSPPKWLVLQQLQKSARDAGVIVRELPDGFRIQHNEAQSLNVHRWVRDLHSQELAYVDLRIVLEQNSGLWDSVQEVGNAFESLYSPNARLGVQVIGSFALSASWLRDFVTSQLRALGQKSKQSPDENCAIDIVDEFYKHVQNTMPGHSPFLESLREEAWEEIRVRVENGMRVEKGDYRMIGRIVTTQVELDKAHDVLLLRAGEDATTQWEKLKADPNFDLKSDVSNIAKAIGIEEHIYNPLLADTSSRKALEEKFKASVADLETQNESDFAALWTDRVDLRIAIYNQGLSSIEDKKLQDQLSNLLATYIQKDLVPDTLVKARSQGLVLSRKTKKNVQKFETTLSSSNPSLNAILSTLAKFSQKSGLTSSSPLALDTHKAAMIQDMQRRMAKQTKSPDGPVLFLTLVVILCAKHYDGFVYATGKYAPKLLKQLRGKLEAGEYEQLEKWKEAAKTGTVGEEDREGMRGMARV